MLYSYFQRICLFIFICLFSTSVFCADFNIKLRKTDINELKQQLLPTFDQNVLVLETLLHCLKQDKTIDICLDQLAVSLGKEYNGNQARQEQIKQDIQQKVNNKDIDQKQIVAELESLLIEIEKVRSCLEQGQTANALKDCVIQYKEQIK